MTGAWQESVLYPLRGKVALVTGGSRGIGAAIARRFAQRGADVAITYRTHPDEAERVAADVRAFGRRCLYVRVDVANREEVASLVERTVSELGRLDVAVANAAVNLSQPVLEATWESVHRTVDVTMFGVFHTLQLAAQAMVRQGRGGKLIAIGSVHAEIPFPTSAAYNMSKSGINNLCRTMARELAPHRINVNVIEPGWIDTEGEHDRYTDEEIKAGLSRVPLGRMGEPDEVAGLALYLASSEADYVTGSILRIDGGITLQN